MILTGTEVHDHHDKTFNPKRVQFPKGLLQLQALPVAGKTRTCRIPSYDPCIYPKLSRILLATGIANNPHKIRASSV